MANEQAQGAGARRQCRGRQQKRPKVADCFVGRDGEVGMQHRATPERFDAYVELAGGCNIGTNFVVANSDVAGAGDGRGVVTPGKYNRLANVTVTCGRSR